jgi:hypothetical protein
MAPSSNRLFDRLYMIPPGVFLPSLPRLRTEGADCGGGDDLSGYSNRAASTVRPGPKARATQRAAIGLRRSRMNKIVGEDMLP